MQENIVSKNNISLKEIKYKFDLITSENGKNWLLALNWILVLEFFSSFIAVSLQPPAQHLRQDQTVDKTQTA